MSGFRRLLNRPVFQVLVFLLGLWLFSWPFWIKTGLRGIGFVFLYFFIMWALMVAVLFLVSQGEDKTRRTDETDREGAGREDV
ncbi:MAG: hypothetical protein AB1896_06030 [Thermodesulfobacteriota bacterium]